MAAEVLGHVTCPFCGNDGATVHREARGLRALYYRCYPACGTVQIRYSGGQAWIQAHMRPLSPPEVEAAAEGAAATAAERQKDAASKAPAKRSALKKFFLDED